MASPYLTTSEAAAYARFKSASGIRTAVMRGQLMPDGAVPRGPALFGSLSAPMRRARKVASIAHRVTAHGLRRTLNTLALQVAPSETIRAIMGHTTAQMTEHYNAPAIDARRVVLGRVIELVHGCGDRSGDPESASQPADSNAASL